MQIIKISPVSFKIILSKEELSRNGVDNILNHIGISGDFFEEIIEETNRLYGNPFTSGAIDAEFFESKDGGGELFLMGSRQGKKGSTYIFSADSSETLYCLCKHLSSFASISDSRLFLHEEKYFLVIFCQEKDSLFLSVLREYGIAHEVGPLRVWVLEEHALTIIDACAIQRIACLF